MASGVQGGITNERGLIVGTDRNAPVSYFANEHGTLLEYRVDWLVSHLYSLRPSTWDIEGRRERDKRQLRGRVIELLHKAAGLLRVEDDIQPGSRIDLISLLIQGIALNPSPNTRRDATAIDEWMNSWIKKNVARGDMYPRYAPISQSSTPTSSFVRMKFSAVSSPRHYGNTYSVKYSRGDPIRHATLGSHRRVVVHLGFHNEKSVGDADMTIVQCVGTVELVSRLCTIAVSADEGAVSLPEVVNRVFSARRATILMHSVRASEDSAELYHNVPIRRLAMAAKSTTVVLEFPLPAAPYDPVIDRGIGERLHNLYSMTFGCAREIHNFERVRKTVYAQKERRQGRFYLLQSYGLEASHLLKGTSSQMFHNQIFMGDALRMLNIGAVFPEILGLIQDDDAAAKFANLSIDTSSAYSAAYSSERLDFNKDQGYLQDYIIREFGEGDLSSAAYGIGGNKSIIDICIARLCVLLLYADFLRVFCTDSSLAFGNDTDLRNRFVNVLSQRPIELSEQLTHSIDNRGFTIPWHTFLTESDG